MFKGGAAFVDLIDLSKEVDGLVAVRYLDDPVRLIIIELSGKMNKTDCGIVHCAGARQVVLFGAFIGEQEGMKVNRGARGRPRADSDGEGSRATTAK
jgi:hypothetical protein